MDDHVVIFSSSLFQLDKARDAILEDFSPASGFMSGPEGDVYSAFFTMNHGATDDDLDELSAILNRLLDQHHIMAVGVILNGRNITAEVLGLTR